MIVPPALREIDAIVYGDAFDAAVTADELVRYARSPSSLERVLAHIRADPGLHELVLRERGLFALADRPRLLREHRARQARARELERRARRIARLLRQVPFVRGLVLTGSAAAGSAGPDADVDLLVLVDRRRIGTVFLALGSLSRVLGRRVFCPNAYVAADAVAYADRTVYVARELAQARTLVGRAGGLLDANPWVRDVFPNARAEAPGPPPFAAGSALQRALELPLAGRAGDRLDGLACELALKRLRVHYARAGRGVPASVVEALLRGGRLSFHASDVDRTALARYESRLAELAARIGSGQLAREDQLDQLAGAGP
jgi:predicted nucleotidyltransferase